MVAITEQQLVALKTLHQWLREQWPVNQPLTNSQCEDLDRICLEIAGYYREEDLPEENAICSCPGYVDARFHSGFLILGPNSATPLHDHAGSFALSLLLAGSANVTTWRCTHDINSRLSYLQDRETVTLRPGEFTSILSFNNLVHKVFTTSNPACLLDIHYPEFTQEQRYWYIPLTDSESRKLTCQRIPEGKFSTKSV